jgi:hypothetical protein
MKTVDQIKNDLAKQDGYSNWDEFFKEMSSAGMHKIIIGKLNQALHIAGDYINRLSFKSFRDVVPPVGSEIAAYASSTKRLTKFKFEGKHSSEFTHWAFTDNLPQQ